MKTRFSAAGVVAAVALLAFTGWITARAKQLEEEINQRGTAINATGKPAPALSLPTLDGRTISLADYHGKKVLLAYWASWCTPCKAEMPVLNRLYAHESPANFGFEILAISVDEDRREAEKFARENSMSFPVLLDPERKTVDAFHVESVPSLIVVDGDGKIVYGHGGFDQRAQMELGRALGFPGRFGGPGGRFN